MGGGGGKLWSHGGERSHRGAEGKAENKNSIHNSYTTSVDVAEFIDMVMITFPT